MSFDLSGGIGPWLWLAAGVLLCAGEMFAPGMFLLWIGIAALATGLLTFAVGLSFAWTLIFFGVCAIASLYMGRRVYGSAERSGDKPFLNKRAEALVGQAFTLDHAIKDGQGRIRVNDSVWRVRGPDLPSGAKVKVVAIEDGVMLRVEPA